MANKPILDPHTYDFDSFIQSITDRDSIGMFKALAGEEGRVRAEVDSRRGKRARANGGGQYAARLGAVLNWFHNDCRFSTLGLSESVACRLLAKHLIERGELSQDIFDS